MDFVWISAGRMFRRAPPPCLCRRTVRPRRTPPRRPRRGLPVFRPRRTPPRRPPRGLPAFRPRRAPPRRPRRGLPAFRPRRAPPRRPPRGLPAFRPRRIPPRRPRRGLPAFRPRRIPPRRPRRGFPAFRPRCTPPRRPPRGLPAFRPRRTPPRRPRRGLPAFRPRRTPPHRPSPRLPRFPAPPHSAAAPSSARLFRFPAPSCSAAPSSGPAAPSLRAAFPLSGSAVLRPPRRPPAPAAPTSSTMRTSDPAASVRSDHRPQRLPSRSAARFTSLILGGISTTRVSVRSAYRTLPSAHNVGTRERVLTIALSVASLRRMRVSAASTSSCLATSLSVIPFPLAKITGAAPSSVPALIRLYPIIREHMFASVPLCLLPPPDRKPPQPLPAFPARASPHPLVPVPPPPFPRPLPHSRPCLPAPRATLPPLPSYSPGYMLPRTSPATLSLSRSFRALPRFPAYSPTHPPQPSAPSSPLSRLSAAPPSRPFFPIP